MANHKKEKVLFLGYDRNETILIEKISDFNYKVEHTSEKVNDLSGFDIIISYGYRHILKSNVLKTAVRPIVNLHISYLPYNRGAHPNFWSFLDNTPSGVSIHEVDEGIDTGPIICQRHINFLITENTFAKTYERLNNEIEQLFLDNFEMIMNRTYVPIFQAGKGTYHSVKDLPDSIKSWDVDISETIKELQCNQN